jgi:hypothetical protein
VLLKCLSEKELTVINGEGPQLDAQIFQPVSELDLQVFLVRFGLLVLELFEVFISGLGLKTVLLEGELAIHEALFHVLVYLDGPVFVG